MGLKIPEFIGHLVLLINSDIQGGFRIKLIVVAIKQQPIAVSLACDIPASVPQWKNDLVLSNEFSFYTFIQSIHRNLHNFLLRWLIHQAPGDLAALLLC